MGFIKYAIENPVKVAVAMLLLTLFGLLSIVRIPIQLTPNVDEPKITIQTFWDGASPREVEREIVERQEEKLKSVPGLKKMTSASTDNRAEVILEFYVGTDKDVALRNVSDKLRQVSGYPDDVDEPTVEAADAALNTPIAWLIFYTDKQDDPATLKDFVEDNVKPILERADGVASVDVYGGREREVQIRVDAAKLAARGITFVELEQALRQQNHNISAGTMASGKNDYSWRTIGQYESVDQVLNTIVAYRLGGPIYVRDVAEVENTFKKQYSFVRSLGQPVLALPVRRETGTNVIMVMNNLKEQIKQVNKDLLEPMGHGWKLVQVYDETVYIDQAINMVTDNIYIGGALTIIVLLFYLRSISATGIVSLCMPLSIIGAFLIVNLLGRPLNVIMLAGMAFATGMVVDNAIVVLENIYRHRLMGKSRAQAALDGAVEVWGAVLGSTLTTMAVFLPVIFIEEEVGQLFRDIAISISAAVGLSLLVALLVIPTVAASHLGTSKALEDSAKDNVSWSAGLIGRLVSWINHNWIRRLAVSSLMIGGSLLGSYLLLVPTDYLPGGNRNLVFGFLITPPGYSLGEFGRMGNVIEESISPYFMAPRPENDDDHTGRSSEESAARQQAEKWQSTVVPQFAQAVTQAKDQLQQAKAALTAGRKPGSSTTPPAQLAPAGESPTSEDLRKNVEAAEANLKKAEDTLRSYEVSPPLIDNFFYVAWGGRCFMGATSREDTKVKPLENLLSEAGSRIPGTFSFFFQSSLFGEISGKGNSLQVEIRGNNLSEVTAAAEQLQFAIMQRFDYPPGDPTNFSLGRPEVRIVPDRVRLANVGLNVYDVGRIVAACVDGAFIPGGFRDQGDEIDMTLLVQGTRDAAPEQVAQVPIYTPTGQIIPLGTVVEINRTTAAEQINHIETMPSVTLTVSPPADMALETATAIIEDEIIGSMRRNGQISSNVFTTTAGNADKLIQTRRALFGHVTGWNLESLINVLTSRGMLAIIITYLLMAALFESYIYPFVIMFTVLPATVGGFLGLAVVHQISLMNPAVSPIKFDTLTMLGFIILLGVVVNNGILLVHQSLNNMRYGMAAQEAIIVSVRTRVRPIMMTAMTTVFGMAPLVFMPGAGSELYQGLGGVMLFGLLVATIFTMILIPALFSMFVETRQIVLRWMGKSAVAPATT
ncbi:MAG: Multidrug resistance protein MdtC [Phycisphaerae bacterium]|nr:Multidrug resistance protein MdtC [Phycisphaerae bacterium]